MDHSWKHWPERAKAAKVKAGKPSDADVSEAVSTILEKEGMSPVKRALVNHWYNGIRHPSLPEFMALCKVLKVNPEQVLFGDKIPNIRNIESEAIREVVSLMTSADPELRGVILAKVRDVISESSSRKKQRLA